MDFYTFYTYICSEVGISPSRLALKIGCSKPMITAWKKGTSFPSDSTLFRIGGYFGIPFHIMKNAENYNEQVAINHKSIFLNLLVDLTKAKQENNEKEVSLLTRQRDFLLDKYPNLEKETGVHIKKTPSLEGLDDVVLQIVEKLSAMSEVEKSRALGYVDSLIANREKADVPHK